VNGRNLVGVTHHEAVDVLKEAGHNVTVVVARLMKKASVRPLSSQPATRTSIGRSQPPSSPTTNDASSPQPLAGGVVLRRQQQSTTPTQSPPDQNFSSSEPSASGRRSGTGSVQYEVRFKNSTSNGGVEYCDPHVCLSVCLHAYFRNHASIFHPVF